MRPNSTSMPMRRPMSNAVNFEVTTKVGRLYPEAREVFEARFRVFVFFFFPPHTPPLRSACSSPIGPSHRHLAPGTLPCRCLFLRFVSYVSEDPVRAYQTGIRLVFGRPTRAVGASSRPRGVQSRRQPRWTDVAGARAARSGAGRRWVDPREGAVTRRQVCHRPGLEIRGTSRVMSLR